MKIAVMISSLTNNADGIARHATRLSRELIAIGHQVTIWAVEYDSEHCQLANGLDVRALRRFPRPAFKSGRIPGLRTLAWLHSIHSAYRDQRALSRFAGAGFDVVNPHGNLIIWSAAQYKRRFGVPIVWMCQDYWPPVDKQPVVSSTARQNIKLSLQRLISLPIKNYDRIAVREVDGIAVLSDTVRAKMAERYGVSAEVVRPGVEGERFAEGDGEWVKSHHRIPDKSFVLLTICSLMARRRLEDVIRAMEALVQDGNDVTYLIAGKTTHAPAYTRFIRDEVVARRLERRVLIVGEVSEKELASYYHACDVFLWPADANQSWGMAGTEAMASGKPIIVSSANGLAEILDDKVTGFVVPLGSPEMIAQVVKQLLLDPAMARSVGQAGQQLVLENYTWRKNARQMLELFERAMDRA